MKPRIYFMIAGVIVVLGILLPKARAVSVTISDFPEVVDQTQEISIPIHLDCQNCSSSSFLRGVFYSAGSSNYFGFTEVSEGTWFNGPGGTCIKYFEVPATMLHEGTWSGMLKIKPDIDSSYYNGPGEYLFKIGRYTGSCSSPTWSVEKTVAITGPTHTPTPSNTNTPMPTATHTLMPTNTPSSTMSPTATSTIAIKNTISPAPSKNRIQESATDSSTVLGTFENISRDEVNPISTESSKSPAKPIVFSLLLVGSGFGLLSGVFAWKKYIEISTKCES